jgi:hypothetical protein
MRPAVLSCTALATQFSWLFVCRRWPSSIGWCGLCDEVQSILNRDAETLIKLDLCGFHQLAVIFSRVFIFQDTDADEYAFITDIDSAITRWIADQECGLMRWLAAK